MYFDWTYLVLVLPCVIFSLWASSSVNSTFKKYSQQLSIRRITGAQAAQRVLSANGVGGVRIERVNGNLTDHFDPRSNVVRLSASTYNSSSVAAIGVAAHECGHAVQHALGYAPLRLRSALVPAVNFASNIVQWILLAGVLTLHIFPGILWLLPGSGPLWRVSRCWSISLCAACPSSLTGRLC